MYAFPSEILYQTGVRVSAPLTVASHRGPVEWSSGAVAVQPMNALADNTIIATEDRLMGGLSTVTGKTALSRKVLQFQKLPR